MSPHDRATAEPDPDATRLVVTRLRAAGCVFAEDEARILLESANDRDALEALLRRRESGEPLERIVGWAEFAGLRVGITAGVFVPRRRTEYLVRRTLTELRHRGVDSPVIVDLCCGSGAVGLALGTALPRARIIAADLDPVAVACARLNLAAVGGATYCGDLYAALPDELRGRVDTLAVNAPYVPSDEVRLMPPEARDYEPLATLDGGEDGLALHARVAAGAAEWLAPGGSLLIETSERQAEGTAALVAAGGLAAVIHRSRRRSATVVSGRLARS
ncbi:putative protein N(5)-glutamine methyltransferase [Galbitalea soli]|uniref:putative protein N(5)-glutamine methyltransferase n=1 Tax=Galbitalea soli TaxID=1268042 RepID=UPI001801EDA7|nr:release factor glutamine methyltransferase [Galbitalea soli]